MSDICAATPDVLLKVPPLLVVRLDLRENRARSSEMGIELEDGTTKDVGPSIAKQ
jgi:hypothetical protein